jgi:hypothetical protein
MDHTFQGVVGRPLAELSTTIGNIRVISQPFDCGSTDVVRLCFNQR